MVILLFIFTVFSIMGCASSGPTAQSPFTLIEGKRIGKLEVVQNEEKGFLKKTRDSLKFDNQYLHARPRIGFKYPGEAITMMNVYDGDKLLKSCDEGSYSRSTNQGGFSGGGGSHVVGAGGKMTYKAAPSHFTPSSEEYEMKYNLECELAEIKDGMTVELLEGDIPVSKYKVTRPIAP